MSARVAAASSGKLIIMSAAVSLSPTKCPVASRDLFHQPACSAVRGSMKFFSAVLEIPLTKGRASIGARSGKREKTSFSSKFVIADPSA